MRVQPGRRGFLKALAGTIALPSISRLAAAAAFSSSSYPSLEVSPSHSGITWVHTAGLSPEKYLPESTGAGCAFLDYDNDGWMDIYLVNSGPAGVEMSHFPSSHDPRLVLESGKRTKIDWPEVSWPQPSQLRQQFTDLPIDRYITIREGEARWE